MKKSVEDPWGDSTSPKNRLTDAQLVVVQLTAHGLNASECARRLNSGEYAQTLGPDYRINARSISRWLKLPHVQAALISCQEQRVSQLKTHEVEHTSTMLLNTRSQLLELVPVAVDTLEEVMKGNGGRYGASRIKAAITVLELTGVTSDKKPAVEPEQTTPTQGITDETYEWLWDRLVRRVLYGQRS